MNKRAWIGLVAAVLVVGAAGGGYALLQSSARDAVERSIADFRASLPPGVVFDHGPYEIDLLERSVTLAAPVLDLNGQHGFEEVTAERLLIAGLEPEREVTRAASVVLEAVRITDDATPAQTLTLERVEARDLVVAGQPTDLRRALLAADLGALTVSNLGFAVEQVDLQVREIALAEVTAGRIGELSIGDLAVDVREPGDSGRIVLGDVSVSGLDFAAPLALAPAELAGLDEAEAMALTRGVMAGISGLAVERLRLEVEELSGPVELAALRLRDPQIVDGVLVGGRSELVDLSLPIGPEIVALGQSQAPGLPLDERLTISGAGLQRYDAAAQSFRFEQSITLHDLMEVDLAVALGDVAQPPHAGLTEAEAQTLLLGASLGAAEVSLVDLGFLQPALKAVAARDGVTPEALRAQILQQVAIDLRALRLGPAGEELLTALERFLAGTGRFRLALAPEEEVPLVLLGALESPRELVELLNPSFAAPEAN